MAYKQKTPMLHCNATIMHSESWNKMRNRTAAVSGKGDGNKVGLAHAEKIRKTPLAKKETLKDVPSQLKKASKMHLAQAKIVEKHIKNMGNSPIKKEVKPVKAKGGGTKKVCLPKAKIASMSKEERQKVINAKRSAAAKGKRVRSSSSNVKGTSSKNLKDWIKQDWRQVADPSKKCGE